MPFTQNTLLFTFYFEDCRFEIVKVVRCRRCNEMVTKQQIIASLKKTP